MRLPISPVRLPKDLSGQKNGQLSASLLKPVPGGRMHHLAADAFLAMAAAAKKGKFDLRLTSAADGYRPLAVQTRTFMARYDNKPRIGKSVSWNGKRWWKKDGVAAAAVPGTSNHGWGLAADIVVTQKLVEWLVKNAATFGFSAELQSENWHWRYVAGDNIPPAVAAFTSKKK